MDNKTNKTKMIIEEEPDEIAMYVVINHSLKMGVGKCVSQGAHASCAIVKILEKMCYEESKLPEPCIRYKKWEREGQAKIVCKATAEQMEELRILPEVHCIIDAGRTQIAPNSFTALAFFPNKKSVMGPIVGHLKLL